MSFLVRSGVRASTCFRQSGVRALCTSSRPAVSHVPVDFEAMPEYPKDAEFPEELGVYSRDHANDILRKVQFPTDDIAAPYLDREFRALVNQTFTDNTPSKHSFFATLKEADKAVVHNPGFLVEFYTRYQAAMHITRAAVWRVPHLDSPLLRQRKIAVIIDDDALDKDSHHLQLENMFGDFLRDVGSEQAALPPQTAFGEAEELYDLTPTTKFFTDEVVRLYHANTGAWCIAEVLSDDWLSALAESLAPHFDGVIEKPYFDEVFTGHVEIAHMMEAVALTELVMARHPGKRTETFDAVKDMTTALNGLWDNLEDLVQKPEPFLK